MQRSQVKRDFTPQQIIQLGLSLGSADYRWDGNPSSPIIFQTICHNAPGNGSYKLYYYPDTHRFHCYTECGDSFDVYELVMRSMHCDFAHALQYVQVTLHLTFANRIELPTGEAEANEDLELLTRYCRLRKRQQTEAEATPLLPPGLIDLYSKIYPIEWQRDHITPDVMERFNIRFDISDNEIIIPHYDVSGGLIGIRSRSLDARKVASGNKYMPTQLELDDFRHTLRNHLYGLDKVKEAIKASGKCMICESEKSVLQSAAYYGADSFTVAVCGSNISTIQRDLVLSLGVREVFLAFDREYKVAYTDESDVYAEKILKLASLFTPYVTTYVIWDTGELIGYKDSPTDHGKEVLETLMRNKFEVETVKE